MAKIRDLVPDGEDNGGDFREASSAEGKGFLNISLLLACSLTHLLSRLSTCELDLTVREVFGRRDFVAFLENYAVLFTKSYSHFGAMSNLVHRVQCMTYYHLKLQTLTRIRRL